MRAHRRPVVMQGRSLALLVPILFAGTIGACGPSPSTDLSPLRPVATNDISDNPELKQFAMAVGKEVYEAHCKTCHGTDLKGIPDQHTPDLTDDHWMFSGDDFNSGGLILFPSDVEKTTRFGIRADHPNTRKDADMPALGPQGMKIVNDQEIADVTEYVLKLSGQPANEQAVMRAADIWNEKGSCYDCHDPEGIGNGAIGGTDLTNPELFLYGSDRDSIKESIAIGRRGVSPAFEGRLSPEQIKAVAVYVFDHASQPEQ